MAERRGKAVMKKNVQKQSGLSDESFQFLLNNHPLFKSLQEVKVGSVQAASDPFHAFRKVNQQILIPPMFEKYPNSPTAQRYLKAFYHYLEGWEILENYQRDTIETEEDYKQLRLAFGCYAKGEMSMQHLFAQFFPPKYTSSLVKKYLLRHPDDTMVLFFHVILNFNSALSQTDLDTSKFELQKEIIIEGEVFVQKILSQPDLSLFDKSMLMHIYELLGSIYTTTKQQIRALDCYQKWYDLDPTNRDAFYNIAINSKQRSTEKAITLLKEYIAVSPVCDKNYPNAHYFLAWFYFTEYENTDEAMKYCKLAEEAEKWRLDFLDPVDIDAKRIMLLMKPLLIGRTKTVKSN